MDHIKKAKLEGRAGKSWVDSLTRLVEQFFRGSLTSVLKCIRSYFLYLSQFFFDIAMFVFFMLYYIASMICYGNHFSPRQLVENYKKRGKTFIWFLLIRKKVQDRVPREVMWWFLEKEVLSYVQ